MLRNMHNVLAITCMCCAAYITLDLVAQIYDPTATLSAERRGTLSMPDIDSCSAGTKGRYTAKVNFLRGPASSAWHNMLVMMARVNASLCSSRGHAKT